MLALVLCLSGLTGSSGVNDVTRNDRKYEKVYSEGNSTTTPTDVPREDVSHDLWRYAIAGTIMLMFVLGLIFLAWYLMKTRVEAKMTYLDIDGANENSRQLAP